MASVAERDRAIESRNNVDHAALVGEASNEAKYEAAMVLVEMVRQLDGKLQELCGSGGLGSPFSLKTQHRSRKEHVEAAKTFIDEFADFHFWSDTTRELVGGRLGDSCVAKDVVKQAAEEVAGMIGINWDAQS